jgi:hypothetical protein
MKQKALRLLIGVLILSACGQVPTTPALQNTSTPTLAPSSTPTETRRSTQTFTPEPTISPTPLFDSEKMNIIHTESVHGGGDILVEGVRIKDLVLATDASVKGDTLTFDPELGRDASGRLTLLKDFSLNETQVAREQVTKAVFYALYEAWKSPENATEEDFARTRSKFGFSRQNISFTQWMAALKAYQDKVTYGGIGVDLEDIQVRIFAYDYGVKDQRYFYFDPTGPVRIVWTENWFQLQRMGNGTNTTGFGTFRRPDASLGLVLRMSDSGSIRDDTFSSFFIQLLKRLSINADRQRIVGKSLLGIPEIINKANDPIERYSCFNLRNNVIYCGIAPASEKGR